MRSEREKITASGALIFWQAQKGVQKWQFFPRYACAKGREQRPFHRLGAKSRMGAMENQNFAAPKR